MDLTPFHFVAPKRHQAAVEAQAEQLVAMQGLKEVAHGERIAMSAGMNSN